MLLGPTWRMMICILPALGFLLTSETRPGSTARPPRSGLIRHQFVNVKPESGGVEPSESAVVTNMPWYGIAKSMMTPLRLPSTAKTDNDPERQRHHICRHHGVPQKFDAVQGQRIRCRGYGDNVTLAGGMSVQDTGNLPVSSTVSRPPIAQTLRQDAELPREYCVRSPDCQGT